MKIYTKTGDKGETSLVDGGRVKKTHPRVEAYGTVDELNSTLGICVSLLTEGKELSEKIQTKTLIKIQNDLFNLGSHLACSKTEVKAKLPTVNESDISLLEREMDQMTKELPPLKEFILPGGHPLSSNLHLARTICRRAERRVVDLAEEQSELLSIQFLNRLSDYLFVLARYVNFKAGLNDITWKKT